MSASTDDPPRRLLAVCAVSHPGGAEIGLLRLLDRLAPRGWQPTLTAPDDGPLLEAAASAGWPVRRLGVGGLGAGKGAGALASWPLARRLSASADVVYLNGTVCGRLLPALTGRHTVLHVHDIVASPRRFWRRASVRLADSEAVTEALGGLDAHVVHCPIELDPPPTPCPWEAGSGPVVGFVGRIEPRKGPLDLIAATAAIRAGRPDVRVVIVGDDPYRTDPDYLEQVRSARDVEHYGWTPQAAGLMRHLDVLVAPSRREPFGTVVAEAMAVGTPVVASRVDGLTEVVEDGVNGVLVAPGVPDALAAGVLRVLANHDAMGAAAMRSARRYDADRYADRVERLIAP